VDQLDPHTFDHHTEEFARYWPDIFALARRQCPVIESSAYGGYYVLTRHADVQALYRDFKHFSSARTYDGEGELTGGGVSVPPQIFRVGFLEMDPPESTKLRRLLNPWFTVKAVDAGRGRIQESAAWAIDNVVERGQCDVVADLASPFPSLLFLDLLGVPLDRWKAYKEITDRVTAQSPDALDGLDWMRADVDEEVRRQRAEGGEGLIADLVQCEVDGEMISQELATELTYMLLLGGTGTTIATIGHALRHFDQHPEDRRRVTEDRSLLGPAVEELIRFYSPAMGLARNATEGANVGGCRFRPGDRVIGSIASANRDEAVFPDADHVDLARSPNPHLSFGTGPHKCIGADFARASIELFLDEVLTRLPDYTIDHDAIVPYPRTPQANGYIRMPMSFTPGQRSRYHSDTYPTFTAPRIRSDPGVGDGPAELNSLRRPAADAVWSVWVEALRRRVGAHLH
jgi:cytochrome P450